MKKSTVNPRIHFAEDISDKELRAFDAAYFQLKDTLEAIERIAEMELLVLDNAEKLAVLTTSMQSMSDELLFLAADTFIAIPF